MDKNIAVPFVSIIMPAYNAEDFIYKAIASVQSQTYTDWELIVVDDGSTDKTPIIVKEFQLEDERISYYYQSNKKQASARNTGLFRSKGDWIAFFDADDIWVSLKLEIQVSFLKRFPADVYYSGGYMIDKDDVVIGEYKSNYGYYRGLEMYKELYSFNLIPILSVLMKKSWISNIGNQDESPVKVGSEDLDYWLRLALNGAIFYGIDEKLFMYRFNPNGTSRNHIQMRLSYASALIDNFDCSIFGREDAKRIFAPLINPLVMELLKLNKIKEVDYLLHSMLKKSRSVHYRMEYLVTKAFRKRAYLPVKVIDKICRTFSLQ